MDPLPLEALVFGFGDVPVESVRGVAARLHAQGDVRVVSAFVVRRQIDGSASVDDWTDPEDVFDLAADLAARTVLGFDRVSAIDVAAELEPGTTVLVLLIEHLWARSLQEDVTGLDGVCVGSIVVPVDQVDDVERRITDRSD
jgi:hypothetical protein